MRHIERSIFLAGIMLPVLNATASACPECRAKVESGIYNQDFSINLFVILLPILILTAAGIALYYADELAKTTKEEPSKWQPKRFVAR